MEKIQLKQEKEVELQILLQIDKICREHKIKYFLMRGTLLGAIKYKGFIPWDDDIDITMSREDYNRFVKIMAHEKGKSNIDIVYTGNSKEYPYTFAKIYDNRTTLDEIKIAESIKSKYDLGIYVDVFPLDYVSENGFLRMIKLGTIRLLDILRLCAVTDTDKLKNNKCIKFIIKLLKKVLPHHSKFIHWIEVIGEHWQNKNTNLVGFCNEAQKKQIFPKSYFEETISVSFEEHMFNVSGHYHEILTSLYGDYTQLPPIDERCTHHVFDAYWKN